MHSTSAKAVLPKLVRIFAAYGVPQVVKSENGPPFNVTNSWFENSVKLLLLGQKQMAKRNAS